MIIGIILAIVLWLSIVAFVIVSHWKVFEKAGQPGWSFLIPIYNILILLKIANKPWWWIFMLLIPIVNIVFAIMIFHRVSLSFGKGAGFTVGLLFLSIIFVIILFYKKYCKIIEPEGFVQKEKFERSYQRRNGSQHQSFRGNLYASQRIRTQKPIATC